VFFRKQQAALDEDDYGERDPCSDLGCLSLFFFLASFGTCNKKGFVIASHSFATPCWHEATRTSIQGQKLLSLDMTFSSGM